MSRKRLTAAVLLGAFLATSLFVAMGGVTAQQDAGPTDTADRFVQVSASGTAEAQPDQAVVNLGVEATADSPDEARQRLASDVSSMRDALSNAGVSDSQIRTTNYDLRERREPVRPEGSQAEQAAYYASHGFEITLSDLDAVGSVIDVAVSNGATRVDNVRFTLSEETRQEVKSEALTEAMSNARGQADTVAQNAQISITGVRSVSTSDTGYTPFSVRAEALQAASADTSIDTGPVTVNAEVNVVYDVS